MNIEKLQKRVNDLHAAIEQTKNNFNLLNGQLNEAVHWLTEASKENSEKSDAPVNNDLKSTDDSENEVNQVVNFQADSSVAA